MMVPFHEEHPGGAPVGVRDRMVNQQVLLQNKYLIAENRILRAHLPTRLRLTDPQRSTLAEIGKRLGRQALQRVACVAKPETILAWYRKLIARKFDGSKYRRYPGRPAVGRWSIEQPRSLHFGPDGWQCSTTLWRSPRSETPPANEMGRLHSISHGRSSRH
jgi:hypothetical protein